MTERLLSTTVSLFPRRSLSETIPQLGELSKLPLSGLGEGVLSRLTGAARVEEVRAKEAIRRGEAGIFMLTRVID